MRTLTMLLLLSGQADAQEFTYRGFAQVQAAVYAETTPQDHERLAVETLLRFEPTYSEAFGAHIRATLAGVVIGGDERDFIGQFHRNSHLLATLRYSF